VLHILARCVDALGRLPQALVSCILNTQVSAALTDPCWGKQTCRILLILALLLHKLVTPSDYSLPGGSSPIASACRRPEALKSANPSNHRHQITGPASIADFLFMSRLPPLLHTILHAAVVLKNPEVDSFALESKCGAIERY
jgi:hypothetical protein